MSDFVHLHNHTEYSPLDGLQRPLQMCQEAANQGQRAIAFTDHGTLGAAPAMAAAGTATGVKVIGGLEAYLAIGDRFAPSTLEGVEDTEGERVVSRLHLTMLAANQTGWTNLVRLTNEAAVSFKSYPLMDYDLIGSHSGGLILGTGCLGGPLATALRSERGLAAGRDAIEQLLAVVDGDRSRLFVEVMDHGIEIERALLADQVQLAREFGLRIVATNDAHFTRSDQVDDHDRWLAIGSDKPMDDPRRFRFNGDGYWLRTEDQMRAIFGDRDAFAGQDPVSNSLDIAEMCEGTLSDHLPRSRPRLPNFPVPKRFVDETAGTGRSPQNAFLHHLVAVGAASRFPDRAREQEVRSRLRFEFDVITQFGYENYFLIQWDLDEWARRQGSPVGPGRGSAAGSLIAYCLRITDVDPLEHKLLFERFLDVTRLDPPDIDTDFAKELVGQVVPYLQSRYGTDNVAQIGTFGSKKARSLVRDLGRVTLRPSLGAKLAAMVPNHPNVTLSALLDENPNPSDEELVRFSEDGALLRGECSNDQQSEILVRQALALEGTKSYPGIHACGVVLSDEPLTGLLPMRKDSRTAPMVDGVKDYRAAQWVTSWESKPLESMGFVKFDRLALKNLDVIARARKGVEEATGQRLDLSYGQLSMDPGDPRAKAAWDLLAAGDTAGLFQLGSSGMTKLVKGIAPTSLGELSAAVALYRPGPMGAGMHNRFVARKRGLEAATYDYLTRDPAEAEVLDSVLGKSYGLIVVQEDLMSLSRVVAGFGPDKRNKLRKAFSKKKKAEMQALREVFFAQAVTATVDDPETDTEASIPFSENTIREIWRTFEASASYLFNSSHSAPYAYIAYQTAYLKANWPAHYAAAQLAVTTDVEDRLPVLASVRAQGVRVLGPDLNAGNLDTAVVDDHTVRLGLSEIAGVKDNAAQLVAALESGGPFTSLADVAARARKEDGSDLPVTVLEALIDAGALDFLGHPRRGMASVIRAVRTVPDLDVPQLEWSATERAGRERSRLGMVVGLHPLQALRDQVIPWDPAGAPAVQIHALAQSPNVTTKGVIAQWNVKNLRGQEFASFVLEGSRSQIAGVMWPDALRTARAANGGDPALGSIVAIRGKVKAVKMASLDGEAGETFEDSASGHEPPDAEEQLEMVGSTLWVGDFTDAADDDLPAAPLLRLVADPEPRPEPVMPELEPEPVAVVTSLPLAPPVTRSTAPEGPRPSTIHLPASASIASRTAKLLIEGGWWTQTEADIHAVSLRKELMVNFNRQVASVEIPEGHYGLARDLVVILGKTDARKAS